MSDNILISKQDANQVLRLAFDDATQALRTTQAALSEQTVVQPDGSLLHTTVDASALPTGAATSAKQDTGNTSVASIDTKTPALVSGRVPVDGSGVTQPVSAASLPLPTGAATSSNQTTANASLSSIDTKLTSPLTVTGPLTDTELRASAVPVSLASSPLPTGAATAANQATEIASLASIDSKLTSPLTVTGPLTDAQLRATPVPVSGTVTANAGTGTFAVSAAALPLPSGASTAANQATEIASLASIDTKTPALGQALAAASVPVVLTAAQLTTLTPLTSVTVTQATGTNLHTVVDSGTVAATQSGTWNVNNVSGTVSLPTGAATETTLAAQSAKLPATLGQKAMTASLAVVLASDQASVPVAATLSAETTKVIGTVNISAAQSVTANLAGKTVSTAPVYTDYSSTSVTTAAYTQLVASTSAAITHLSIFDSSGNAMILATGAAASEVIKLYIPPGGGEFDLAIPISTRISIKALTANSTSGYNLLNMLS